MCQVLKSNFENYLPSIEKAVKEAEFVGMFSFSDLYKLKVKLCGKWLTL